MASWLACCDVGLAAMTLDGVALCVAGWEGSHDQDGAGEYLDQVRANRKQREPGGATCGTDSNHTRRRSYIHTSNVLSVGIRRRRPPTAVEVPQVPQLRYLCFLPNLGPVSSPHAFLVLGGPRYHAYHAVDVPLVESGGLV